ncbi:hypothetical protein MKX01_019617 [Papaver californicum]|nr:hypothetical protein MKX01_019617 [Papaver californicum]
MESSTVLLSRLILVLFILGLAEAIRDHQDKETMRRPGFMYSRIRGRCTPQFWSSRREAWPRMVPQTSSVSKVFGSRVYERYRIDLTLLEATERNDDNSNAFSSLLKQSSAALLNSYSRKDYPYTAWEVKTALIQALVSEEAANLQAQRFSHANEACT